MSSLWGQKCDERSTSSPFPIFIENTLLTLETECKNKLKIAAVVLSLLVAATGLIPC